MSEDEKYMQRCLQLAELGLGKTAPNPMVGAVIVWKNQIIGEGYHHAAGMPHAEVEAVSMVNDPEKLHESTLYLNLEPCNHTGRTPPCTDLIIRNKIPKVVVGQVDPNPLVGGKGLERLKKNGVEIIQGVLENEAKKLNRRFNVFHSHKRPYILLKWAKTSDGFMDQVRIAGQKANPAWITDEYCRILVHKWRTEEPSILVGTHTAILDNPQLNVRAWSGDNPIRLVLDRKNSLPDHLKLFDQSQETWVFSEIEKYPKKNLKYIKLDPSKNDLDQLMEVLFEKQIQSVMVEGGSELLSSFINKNLWDEARVFTGPGSFGQGVAAPVFNIAPDEVKKTGNSMLRKYFNAVNEVNAVNAVKQ